MKIGIIGKERAGKSLLYGVLSGIDTREVFEKKIYFQSIDIPDERLLKLEDIYNAQKTTFNKLMLYDFPMYDPGNDQLRSMDGYIIVLGDHPVIEESPQAQLDDIFGDLYLKDIEILQKRYETLTKGKRKDDYGVEEHTIEELLDLLEKEENVYEKYRGTEKAKVVKGFQLFSIKPIFVIINSTEPGKREMENNYNLPVFNISGEDEMDIAMMDGEERSEFLEMMGIENPAKDKFINKLYSYLNLITFYSCAETEVHAWPLKKGSNIVEAAGVIHTDMMKNFIKAEIIAYDDLIKAGSEEEAKKQNLDHLEGKNYIVKDGDIVFIKFQKK